MQEPGDSRDFADIADNVFWPDTYDSGAHATSRDDGSHGYLAGLWHRVCYSDHTTADPLPVYDSARLRDVARKPGKRRSTRSWAPVNLIASANPRS